MQAKKAAKAAKKRKAPLAPPRPDAEASEPRAITREIEKNKGLTPHQSGRRNAINNPRVKGKLKFADKEKRRKGQVQAVRSAAGPYGGESSGIKSRVTKSTRFG
jgi:U3 small nucleolar RNA-associated protein 3